MGTISNSVVLIRVRRLPVDIVAAAVGTIASLKQEEALDAAANAFSVQSRQPCAGKPCFAVIDDPRFRGVHSGK